MEKKLYRSVTDRKIAGVCGGLAKYFGFDVNIVRVIATIAVLFTGIGLVAYIAAALLIPDEPFNDKYPD